MSYYRPLPYNLTIKKSLIDGLGLFATEDIDANTDLGPTHILNQDFEDGVIRLPLGGFFNHSNFPNCKIIEGIYNETSSYKCLRLITIKDIKAGEELTAKYTLYTPKNEID